MLQAVNGDRPLRDLRLKIAWPTLSVLIGVSRKLTWQHDLAISPPRGRDAFGVADMAVFDQHGVGVVERDDPAAHHRPAERMLVLTVLPYRCDLLQVGQHCF